MLTTLRSVEFHPNWLNYTIPLTMAAPSKLYFCIKLVTALRKLVYPELNILPIRMQFIDISYLCKN